MKRLLSFVLVLVMVLGMNVSAATYEKVELYVNRVEIKTDQPAIIVGDRTLVPLRPICEALKCEVTWNDETQTAQIQNEVTIVAVQIENYTMTKVDRENQGNVQNIQLDVPPLIYNNRTMVPARAIAEALHAVVSWSGEQKRVDITMEFDFIGHFYEGLACAGKDGKRGFITEDRKIAVPLIYDFAWGFDGGYSIVGRDGKFGQINKSGIEVVPVIYDSVDAFTEGLARAMKGDKWGYVNTSGEEVIPFIYDSAGRFSGGSARVEQNGKSFYINERGLEINTSATNL